MKNSFRLDVRGVLLKQFLSDVSPHTDGSEKRREEIILTIDHG